VAIHFHLIYATIAEWLPHANTLRRAGETLKIRREIHTLVEICNFSLISVEHQCWLPTIKQATANLAF
jgi:hypothetical protein